MSMNNPSAIERSTRGRYLQLLIIWVAQMMALAIFFLLSLFVFQRNEPDDATLLWVLSGFSVMLVAASFVIKRKLFAQAVERQSIDRIQHGQIVAVALCEAAGLSGFVARAVTGTPYFYLPLAIAALGMLLHFPRRETLMAASFKNRI